MNRPLTISGLIWFSVILSCMCRVTVGDSDCTNVRPELETCANYSFLTQEALEDGGTGICSTEGRQSLSCILEFRQLCPTSALGEDLVSKVNSSGGIDAYCTVHGNQLIAADDPADEVSCVGQCLQYAQAFISAEAMKILHNIQEVSGKAIYLSLPYTLELLCGPIKAYFLCLMDILPTCPGIEQQLKSLQIGGLATNSSISNFGMMAKFMRSYCPIDNGLSSHADCASTAMNTTVFSKCLNKTLAKIKGNKNCASYNLVKQCVTTAVASPCGNEAARLVSAGMSLMYPTYIPIDCETAAVVPPSSISLNSNTTHKQHTTAVVPPSSISLNSNTTHTQHTTAVVPPSSISLNSNTTHKQTAAGHASGTHVSSLTLFGGLSVFIMHRIYNF